MEVNLRVATSQDFASATTTSSAAATAVAAFECPAMTDVVFAEAALAYPVVRSAAVIAVTIIEHLAM